MNKPSPLIPQGALPQSTGKGASNVRIAVATIIALHVVFFGGLLLQGCKRDNNTAGVTQTNAVAESLTLPVLTNREAFGETNSAPVASDVTSNYQTPGSLGNAGVASNVIATPEPAGGAAPSPAQTSEYTVVRNDTLSKIAHAHGTTSGAIAKANPGIDPMKLKVGQKIQLPVAVGVSTATANAPADATATSAAAGVHVVKSGETLTRIAKQHGVTVKALRTANGLKTDRLVAGQKLKLPAHGTAANSGAGNAPGASVQHGHGH